MRRDPWWIPLTGALFLVLLITSFVVGGEPPDADSPAREIVEHYVDNKDAVIVGAMLSGLAASLFVFFAGYLRKVLRRAEGEGGVLSTVALVGAGILATGAAIDATISFALAEAAGEVDPAAVQALQALWDNDFVPMAVGLQVFLLAAGLSIVRHGALPKWLGWLAVMLGVLAVTPAGFVAFMGGALWVLAASVLLALGLRRAEPAGTP